LLPGGIVVAWIVVVVVVVAAVAAAADVAADVAQGIPSSPRNDHFREIYYPDIVVDIEKWNQ
ncbi:hypothetical protein A2U01_0113988, partial [Trifolium medium]|nr:hypothetical protein [Trifolium medium]